MAVELKGNPAGAQIGALSRKRAVPRFRSGNRIFARSHDGALGRRTAANSKTIIETSVLPRKVCATRNKRRGGRRSTPFSRSVKRSWRARFGSGFRRNPIEAALTREGFLARGDLTDWDVFNYRLSDSARLGAIFAYRRRRNHEASVLRARDLMSLLTNYRRLTMPKVRRVTSGAVLGIIREQSAHPDPRWRCLSLFLCCCVAGGNLCLTRGRRTKRERAKARLSLSIFGIIN